MNKYFYMKYYVGSFSVQSPDETEVSQTTVSVQLAPPVKRPTPTLLEDINHYLQTYPSQSSNSSPVFHDFYVMTNDWNDDVMYLEI